MQNITIVTDRDQLDMDLLLMADSDLPRVTRNMQQCYPFTAVLDGKAVAVCLLSKKETRYDIVNFAVHPAHRKKGLARHMLRYVMDFVRVQGGRYMEIGCSNACVELFVLLQQVGFRMVGIWKEHYETLTPMAAENGIIHRDMLRFRIDLKQSFTPMAVLK